MKKYLALLMAILMLFSLASLAACGEKQEEAEPEVKEEEVVEEEVVEEEPGETEEEKAERLANSLPNEYGPEKLEAGMDVTVALLAVEFGASAMQELDEGFKNGFEAAGYKYTSGAFNLDTALQISSIENYVTMGCALIITMSFDDSIQDTVAQAIEAGTYVAMWNCDVQYPVSLQTNRDAMQFGTEIGLMLNAWAEYAHPGEVVKTALLDNISNPTYVVTVEQLKAALDPEAIEIAYEAQAETMDVDSGFNFAENAFTANGDITCFIGMTFAQALGMSNFLDSKGVDKTGYGVFAYDKDAQAEDFLADDTNAFRGYVAVGGDNQYDFMLGLALQLLAGELEPGTKNNETIYVHTDFGYEV